MEFLMCKETFLRQCR